MTATDRTSTIAAVRRGDLTAQEIAESHKPSAKIEDFGEKIGGAKKDLRQTYQKAMSEVLPVDAKNITLSPKTGPSPFRMQNTVSARSVPSTTSMHSCRLTGWPF